MFNNTMTTDNILIEDLIYIPVGNYLPMYIRPYQFNVNGHKLDDLVTRLEDTKSAVVNSNILAGLTNDIIQNSAVPIPSIINNDWVSTRKFIFLLKVKSIDALNTIRKSYIFGYTNYDGITNSGIADPQLGHNINNVIETTVFTRNTPLGIYEKEVLQSFYNVTTNEYNNHLITQRPYDVFSNSTLKNVANIVNFSGSQFNVYDKNFTFYELDRRPIVNNIENNIPSEYLSKIINTGLKTIPENELFISSHTTEYDNDLAAKVPEPRLSDNKFIRLLNRISGDVISTNKFRFNDLMTFDSTIANRFKLYNITNNYVDPLISQTPEVGDYWHGQDPITLKSYSIIESSVAMALKHGFSKIYFIASNKNNPLGQPNIFITHFNSFIDLDEISFNTLLEIFKSNFELEIFLNESLENRIPLHIEMYVDMLGTTKIYLDYADFGGNWYTIPTFANATFTPIITFDKTNLDILTDGLTGIIDHVLTSRNNFSVNNYY